MTDSMNKLLRKLQIVAQWVTVGAAVSFAILYGVDSITKIDKDTFDVIDNILMICVVGGGMAMGLFYIIGPKNKDKKES